MPKDYLHIVNINNTDITAATKESILTLINQSDQRKSMPLNNKPLRMI